MAALCMGMRIIHKVIHKIRGYFCGLFSSPFRTLNAYSDERMSNEDPHNKDRISRSPAHLPGGTAKLAPASFVTGANILREELKNIPGSPGVYRMISAKGEILYVGKARNLKKRVTSYTQAERLPNRLQRMVALVANLEITITHTESEALLLEANLIRHHQPPFNILLRDDKSYPYILITRDHDFPQVVKYRGSKSQKGWYYGPFASSEAVVEMLTFLMRSFRLRNCTDSVFSARKRPCLQYHIKRCTAPCVGKVTVEEYAVQVKEARDFLAGKDDSFLHELQERMNQASDAQDYEEAASLRDRIRMLAAIHSRQKINIMNLGDADVVALHRAAGQSCIQVFFFRNDRNYGNRAVFLQHEGDMTDSEVMESFLGQFYADKPAPRLILVSHLPEETELLEQALREKNEMRIEIAEPKLGDKKALIDMALENAREALARRLADRKSQDDLLAGLATRFNLIGPPQRIEVYDNSHVSGQHAVGCMIVAGPEGFIKKAYRKFNIKSEDITPGDDYGMMREMLQRRFARAIEEYPERTPAHWPDLVLIDGGQGQLSAAQQVMDDLGLHDIPVVGVAKGPQRDAGRERFFMKGVTPFMMEPREPVLYYLQRLRDEAHRFAIGTHRTRRAKAISASPLDSVPGIGPTRKKKLLLHFGSAQGVSRAGIEDLMRVPGISADLAKIIYEHFHS